jgi:hypothetical protein
VAGAIEWLRAQPYVDKDRVLVVGQSHGGLTTMALGALNPPGVRGLVNFAGGLKYTSSGCIWENSLAQAFARYGAKSRLPSLWFYGDNDSYFPPDVWKDLEAKYRGAGGNVKLIAFGRFGGDAHGMFSARSGLAIWVPEMEKFLDGIGMPSKPVVEVSDVPRMPRTDFAKLDDVAAVPLVHDGCRKAYGTFIAKSPLPRAFAISPTGSCGWAYEGDDPRARALANCGKVKNESCKLYAVDEDVVWQP